jgi:alpha-mannosidase
MCGLGDLTACSEKGKRLSLIISGARRHLPVLFILCALVLTAVNGLADEKLIWQIGKRDNSTLEFNDRWDFVHRGDPKFAVGISDPHKDWSGFHPGSNDQAHGGRIHPFTISFQLKGTPKGVFYLTIDLLFKVPGIPQYFVTINGRTGRFYFRPNLSYDIGDPDTAWNIIFSNQRLRVPLPAAYLRQGENRLVLRCVDDQSHSIISQAEISGGVSGVYYDDLELSNDPAAKFPQAGSEASATPTIFYRERLGSLREVVLLEVAAQHRFERGSISLKVLNGNYSCDLPASYDFGENRCSVEVPAFQGQTRGEIRTHLGVELRTSKVSLSPARKWKLFLAPLIHLDMGYTDYRPNSYEVHNRNIDQIVSAMESHPEYKFNPDGAFIFQDYWKHRGTSWQKRCLALLREKRLAFPAQLFTINTGLASQEELTRFFYPSATFARKYGVPLTYANQTDVPAHVWALPSYLNGIGVKHLVISSNPWRGPIIPYGRLNEKSPFWWEGPDGSKVLTWFSRQYAQLEDLFTHQVSIAAGVNSLPIFLQAYSSSAYSPDAVLVYGTQSDNHPFAPGEVEFPKEWNKEFAYPSITTATIEDFFQYVVRHFAASFPTLRGDGGAWWEEMAAADARHLAMARRAKEKVIGAEEAASLANIVNKDFVFPLDRDHEIWRDLLLYTEHTWGASRTWSRPKSDLARTLLRDKETFSRRATSNVDYMMRRGLSQLEDKISLQGPAVVVFNPLSWKRSGLVEVDLGLGQGLTEPKTGRPVPLEIVRHKKDEDYNRVRFWAADVPAAGYRCYTISASSASVPATALPVSNTFENAFYRVVVDTSRGGIRSLYDKVLGKELVDSSSPYALDQYVYAGYGHEGVSLIRQRTEFNSSLLQFSSALPRPSLVLSTGGQGRILAIRKTPWGMMLVMKSSAAHTPVITTEIRLFDSERKVEIVNRVHKDVVRAPEGVYFAFPFAGERPVVRYEGQNAWIDPTKDQLPGANKEWFIAQHWVAVTTRGLSVGLAVDEAPLFTLGDIDRGLWPKTLDIRNGTVFSYIMDNYDGDDERPFQGGDYTFHYAITSSPSFEPWNLARFGREEDSPIEVDQVTAADKAVWSSEPLDRRREGFIKIDTKEVILAAWKGAEDGRGQILRFYNTTDRPAEARIAFPHLHFGRVYRTNLVEVDQQPVEPEQGCLVLSFKGHEILTLRVLDLTAD